MPMDINVTSNCKVVDIKYLDNSCATIITILFEVESKIVTAEITLAKKVIWSIVED